METSADKATLLKKLWLLEPPVAFSTLTLSTGGAESLEWQSIWPGARWKVTVQTEVRGRGGTIRSRPQPL